MARQTKVDSAERSGVERRAEDSSASFASEGATSGAYAARAEPRTNGTARAARAGGDVAVEEHTGPAAESAGTGGRAPATGGSATRVPELATGALAAEAFSADGFDDDEDVSLDELLISDSAEGDDEEEATDIHPGLSEAVLAESLRGAVTAAPVARALSVEEPERAEPSEPLAAARHEAEELSSQPELAAPVVREEPTTPDASPAEAELLAAEVASAAAAADGTKPAEAAQAEELASEPYLDVPSAPDSAALDAATLDAASLDAASPDAAAAFADAQPPRDAETLAAEAEQAAAAALAEQERARELQLAPATEVELDAVLESAEPPPVAAGELIERETVPETLQAKRGDGPLPSFDIPDLEAAAADAPVLEMRPRVDTRPMPSIMPELAEIDEDDESDEVTHMGLPTVPEAANDYPGLAANAFQVADPAVAALASLDAELSRGDTRRATTRVIPRLDPRSIPTRPPKARASGPSRAMQLQSTLQGAWGQVSRFAQSTAADLLRDGETSPRRRLSWMLENVLPPLSLVLFGSGLGAGIMLLQTDHTPARAAQPVQAVQALQEAPVVKAPTTLAERARSGDGEALYKITNMPHGERTSALTLALEAGYQAQKLKEFKDFSKSLPAPGAAPLPAASVSRFVDFAASPETTLAAFQELTGWSGSTGPDVLYAVWERAAGGSRAASLAQQLLYSADQRAKATPALVTALDLRSATTCDDYLRVLPAVLRDGDQRSLATLRSLRHADGCGADGKQDCYACLRDSTLLEDALRAIEKK